MLSTTQLEYLRPLVAKMREEGYLYYLAYGVYSFDYSSSYNNPDLIVYFSKEEIFGKSMYSYTIPSNSLKYSVKTGNASSNYQTQRVEVSTISSIQIGMNIPVYSHVSTNATFLSLTEVQPDMCLEVKSNETQGAIV